MKVRFSSLLPKWLKRQPKVIYVVCPSCQRQAIDPDPPEVRPVITDGTRREINRLVAQAVVEAVRKAQAKSSQMEGADDSLVDKLLADIEAGFLHNVADIAWTLQRRAESGEPL